MVEWKKLGDLCEIGTGSNNREDACENGSYPFFVRSKEVLRINTYLFDEEAILIPGEGGVGEIFHYIKGKYGLHQRTYRVHPKSNDVIGKFIYYYLFENFGQYINRKSFKSTATSIRKPMLIDFLIPIPSLSEQNRIVGILDTFTDSIENLKQQIAQRRKQFEFYRDQLLDLEGKEGVEMKTLGEIGKCMAGATPSTKKIEYWENGTISWMSSGEVHQGVVTHTASFITQKGYDNASTKMLPIGTVVIALAGQGKTRGTVAITAIELCTNQSLCGVVIENEDILNKYVYYYLKTRYNDLRRISSGDGTRGGLNLKMIGTYPIPLPPLSEQSRIVSILDTFEASITNLEAQLAQRQKQYEYYRNQLLTFE